MPHKWNELEEGPEDRLDFAKLERFFQNGGSREKEIMPVVVQHSVSREVLFVAFANREALEHSLRKKIATFWSTSRQELWIKGSSSGNFLEIVEIRANCEQTSLLYLVRPKSQGACHTRDASGNFRRSCYYRKFSADGKSLEKIDQSKEEAS